MKAVESIWKQLEDIFDSDCFMCLSSPFRLWQLANIFIVSFLSWQFPVVSYEVCVLVHEPVLETEFSIWSWAWTVVNVKWNER